MGRMLRSCRTFHTYQTKATSKWLVGGGQWVFMKNQNSKPPNNLTNNLNKYISKHVVYYPLVSHKHLYYKYIHTQTYKREYHPTPSTHKLHKRRIYGTCLVGYLLILIYEEHELLTAHQQIFRCKAISLGKVDRRSSKNLENL